MAKNFNTKSPEINAARYKIFLEQLGVDGNVSRACEVAQLQRKAVYEKRNGDPEFEKDVQAAFEVATDKLEAEARRRAMEGVEEPVFHQGVEVARVRKYSDSLLGLMLKGNRRKYATNTTEVANAPGESFKVEETPTEIARRLAFVLTAGLRDQPGSDS